MKDFAPRTIEEFGAKANCMLFAYDKEKDKSKSILDYNLWGFRTTPIKEIVEKSARDLGIVVRKISSQEECPDDKYLIAFFLHAPQNEYGDYDYHFIRRELDGKWVEKPNWNDSPCVADFHVLEKAFGNPTFFVIEGIV